MTLRHQKSILPQVPLPEIKVRKSLKSPVRLMAPQNQVQNNFCDVIFMLQRPKLIGQKVSCNILVLGWMVKQEKKHIEFSPFTESIRRIFLRKRGFTKFQRFLGLCPRFY